MIKTLFGFVRAFVERFDPYTPGHPEPVDFSKLVCGHYTPDRGHCWLTQGHRSDHEFVLSEAFAWELRHGHDQECERLWQDNETCACAWRLSQRKPHPPLPEYDVPPDIPRLTNEEAQKLAYDAEPLPTQHDPVNFPQHYTSHPSGVECIEITEHANFCIGNAIKYLWRADEKLGSADGSIEDLRKAVWYVEREIERRLRPQHLSKAQAQIINALETLRPTP